MNFPFTAIVGQAQLQQTLICTAIDGSIGGVLIYGDRGTGKSTAVRALADVLPKVAMVKDCPYRCDPQRTAGLCERCTPPAKSPAKPPASTLATVPVVTLPLGATDDRVVGALDIERALVHGERKFEPGLLAQANRGFLYIDEVNLLEDHLVDLLLDVAASGENLVEREGLSLRHPARFVLLGSGNPEEGELRPQLLDRFGLCVDVRTPEVIADRIAIIKMRDEFERDSAAFLKRYSRKQSTLRRRITAARERLESVTVSDELLHKVAELCSSLGTDGLRGELTLMRTARAIAAFDGKEAVTLAHLRSVAEPALAHRLRRDPLDDSRATVRVRKAADQILG